MELQLSSGRRAVHRALVGLYRAEKTKQRVTKARDLKIGMKNNNQKHFRDQMLQ
jgi:hypothetical protein